MITIVLFLALVIGVPLVVATLRAHFIRAGIEMDQRVRCVLEEIDVERWEKEL